MSPGRHQPLLVLWPVTVSQPLNVQLLQLAHFAGAVCSFAPPYPQVCELHTALATDRSRTFHVFSPSRFSRTWSPGLTQRQVFSSMSLVEVESMLLLCLCVFVPVEVPIRQPGNQIPLSEVSVVLIFCPLSNSAGLHLWRQTARLA